MGWPDMAYLYERQLGGDYERSSRVFRRGDRGSGREGRRSRLHLSRDHEEVVVHPLHLQPLDERRGDITRLHFKSLAERHRYVALVITELGLCRPYQQGISIGVFRAERIYERAAQVCGDADDAGGCGGA